jgi:DivIVA domain-containing protein
MDHKVELTAKEILNKSFTKDVKGYNSEEVDAFLDRIIVDYGSFAEYQKDSQTYIASIESKLKALEADKQALLLDQSKTYEQKKQLEIENASMKNRLSAIKPGDKVSSENFEYIARLNQLESFLYSIGYDPKTLKKHS